MRIDYNRYEIFKNQNGTTDQLPYVTLPANSSDKYETWKAGFSRLDKVAKRYYGNEFFDFLILWGNPQYISEFDIEDGDLIRIPFPLEKVKTDYETELKKIRDR